MVDANSTISMASTPRFQVQVCYTYGGVERNATRKMKDEEKNTHTAS